MMKITICPTCGSNKIRLVRRDWTGNYKGEPYIVPDLEFHECPDCGERMFGKEAMEKIEAHSPKLAKARLKKKAA